MLFSLVYLISQPRLWRLRSKLPRALCLPVSIGALYKPPWTAIGISYAGPHHCRSSANDHRYPPFSYRREETPIESFFSPAHAHYHSVHHQKIAMQAEPALAKLHSCPHDRRRRAFDNSHLAIAPSQSPRPALTLDGRTTVRYPSSLLVAHTRSVSHQRQQLRNTEHQRHRPVVTSRDLT